MKDHRYGLFVCRSGAAGFLGGFLPKLFERGSIDLIDSYKLYAVEHRPVIENAGQSLCLFKRVHMDKTARGCPVYRFPLVLL